MKVLIQWNMGYKPQVVAGWFQELLPTNMSWIASSV